MKQIKLTVPRLSDIYMLYVYRSTSPEDINTIEKVRAMQPVFSIDETVAEGDEYILFDSITAEQQEGVQYYGPTPNTLPVTEYTMNIDQVMRTQASYANVLTLSPLSMPYAGTMLYYSIIGVDLSTNVITHLSKVNGVYIDEEYNDGTVDLYCCSDDPYAQETEWTYLGNVPYGSSITIGDTTDDAQWQRWGNPMIETVPNIDSEDCSINTRQVSLYGYCVLSVPNPWYNDDINFNYRRLKSFKLRNVLENAYGNFSEPTYQSLLPMPIERMTILINSDTEDQEPISYDTEDENIYKITIIRRNGLYYIPSQHKKLGLNKSIITIGEHTAVYAESSTGFEIDMQVPCFFGTNMNVTVYLEDGYNISEPTVFFTEVV